MRKRAILSLFVSLLLATFFALPLLLAFLNPARIQAQRTGTYDWPQQGKDGEHSYYASSETSLHPPLSVKWQGQLGGTAGIPAVADGIVFINRNDNGELFALDVQTGNQLWTYQSSKEYVSVAAVENGRVFVTEGYKSDSTPASALALNAKTGQLIWQQPIIGLAGGTPTVSQGVFYTANFENGHGNVFAFDASSGALLWKTPVPNGGLTSPPTVGMGRVFVNSYTGEYYALDATSGSILWTITPGGLTGEPQLMNGVLYISGSPGYWAVNPENGQLLWSFATGTYCPVALADGVVYADSTDANSKFYALNATTGAKIWEVTFPENKRGGICVYPNVANGVLYINYPTDNSFSLIALDKNNGNLLWTFQRNGTGFLQPVAISSGMLFVSSAEDGLLYALQNDTPAATPLTGTGSSTPNPAAIGGTVALKVTVTPGTNPTSTGLTVTADLSSIGGSATQAFSGSGNDFTFNYNIPASATAGAKNLAVTIKDAQGRIGNAAINLTLKTPVQTCQQLGPGQLSQYPIISSSSGNADGANPLSNLTDQFSYTFWRWLNYPKAIAVEVNLGSPKTLSALKLFVQNPTKAPNTYFQYKDNTGQWSDIPSFSSQNAGANYGWTSYLVPNFTAQNWRMVVDNTTYLSDIANFGDLQFCNLSLDGTGQAISPVSGSQTPVAHRLNITGASGSGGTSASLLDGLTWTEWSVSGKPATASVEMDLGQIRTVTALKYFSTSSAVSTDTAIQYWDGSAWVTITGLEHLNTGNYGPYGLQAVPNFAPVQISKIRFMISNTAAKAWTVGGYGDIQIFGY